jgi:hypothetical protein
VGEGGVALVEVAAPSPAVDVVPLPGAAEAATVCAD